MDISVLNFGISGILLAGMWFLKLSLLKPMSRLPQAAFIFSEERLSKEKNGILCLKSAFFNL